jgi:hypothetical protein
MSCPCADPGSFVWFLSWPAYAIAHGQSLFFSSRLHAPVGINLLDNTSVLLVGTLLAPVTWLFGPVVTLNVALTLAPVTAGLSAYACLRRGLGVGAPAAALGGLLFGFSPYMLRNLAVAHLMTTWLVLIPPLFLCLYRVLVRPAGRWWRWGLALALLVTGQYFISVEVLAVFALVAGVTVVGALVMGLVRRDLLRARMPFAGRALALGVGLGALLLAYPLWFELAGPQHLSGAVWTDFAVNGLRDVLWPGHNTQLAQFLSVTIGYLGPNGASSGYLGLPALAVLAVACVVVRRPLVWACTAMMVLCVWLSLGARGLTEFVGTTPSWVPLPWGLFDHLPLIQNISPTTFSAMALVFFLVPVVLLTDAGLRRLGSREGPVRGEVPVAGRSGVAALARGPAGTAVLLGALVLALVVPWALAWSVPYRVASVPPSTWTTRYGSRLAPSTLVLFNPVPSSHQDQAEIWQAQAGLPFRLVGGRGLVPGPGGEVDHGWTTGTLYATLSALALQTVPKPPVPDARQLARDRATLRRWGVDEIVVSTAQVVQGRSFAYPAVWFSIVMGQSPRRQGDAFVWTGVQRRLAALGSGA